AATPAALLGRRRRRSLLGNGRSLGDRVRGRGLLGRGGRRLFPRTLATAPTAASPAAAATPAAVLARGFAALGRRRSAVGLGRRRGARVGRRRLRAVGLGEDRTRLDLGGGPLGVLRPRLVGLRPHAAGRGGALGARRRGGRRVALRPLAPRVLVGALADERADLLALALAASPARVAAAAPPAPATRQRLERVAGGLLLGLLLVDAVRAAVLGAADDAGDRERLAV